MNLLHSGPLTIFLGHQLSPEREDTIDPPILLVLHTLHRLSPQTSSKLCPCTLIGMNGRLEIAEEQINSFEDTATETIQKKHTEKKS